MIIRLKKYKIAIILYSLMLSVTAEEVIVITADRTAVNELKSAYSTILVYEDEVRKKGYRSTVEIMKDIPGILLQKTAHGQGSPYIRGFTGFRNLFLIDGIRLNNSVFREGPNQYWNTVDAFSIEKFEIVKGPTSVVYGSDAIGGTVNVITKLQSIDDAETESSTALFFRRATAGQSNIIRAKYSKKLNPSSAISVGITDKKFGNLIAGGNTNEQLNTGYDEINYDIKLITAFSSTLQLTTAYFKTRQDDVPRTHKTIYGVSFAGTTVGNELQRNLNQERELAYAKLNVSKLGELADSAEIMLSYQNQNEIRHRLRTKNRNDIQGVDVKAIGLGTNFFKQNVHSFLTYGVEYYLDNVDSFSSQNTIQGPVADDAKYEWLGVYGQQKFELTNNTDVDFGIRWNYMAAKANKVMDPFSGKQTKIHDSWDTLLGNMRVNFELIPKQQSLYVGISQGFRAPNLSDLTRFDTARSNEFEIPSIGLKPEHYVTFDTGLKYRSVLVDYNISIYYTAIRDQIQRVPTGRINDDREFEITKMNLGDGYAYGGELEFKWRMTEKIDSSTSMAYVNGKVDTFPDSTQSLKREYLDRLMPTNAKLSFRYSSQSDNWWISSTFTAFAKANRLSTRDQSDTQRIPPKGTPGFVIWNMGGGYVYSDSTTLNFNVENVLDKDYRLHGSGQNEAGLNIIASVIHEF